MPALFPTTLQGASSGAELVSTDGRALPLEATTLRAEVQGGLARFVLEQTYRNAYEETLQVVYRMPLPAEGAVSGYAFEIGGRIVRGEVDRKRAARDRFEQAIASGHTAALLEQETQDIFTQRIGNIPSGETIIARITVDQRLAWLPEGEWELRFPTVIGPRYCGSAETAENVRATHLKVTEQPLRVTVQLALSIKDAITGGKKPSSTTHALAHREDGVIELAAGARLDRDLVVRWPVAAPEVGVSLALARPTDGDAFGLVTVVPPASSAKRTAVARDLIVLLDTSGSMDGVPLTKAKQVVSMVIDSLAESDRFELIEFSDSPTRYKREPLLASAKAKQEAIQWVRSRQAAGGTEMRKGVLEALQTLRVGAQRQVIVVTDGYIGGEQQILKTLHDHLPRSCRLHVLGVGDAVNRSLATQLSRAGRGVEVLVGDRDDAERGAKRLLDRTRAPMMVNVEIAGSALLRHAPEQMPDVFAGAPLVAGLVLRPEGGELIVRGELADGPWEQRVRVPAQKAGDGTSPIAALYARELIADLEARSMLESVDSRIEELGLQYQLATRMTSWVAVDESRVVANKPSREVVVPQEIPHGTSVQAFGLRPGMVMPQTMMMAGMALGGVYDAEEEGFAANMRTRAGVVRSPMPTGAPPPAAAPAQRIEVDEMRAEPIEAEKKEMLYARKAAPAAPSRPMAAARTKGGRILPRWMLFLVLALLAALIYWLVR
ncbi:MAG: VIT domain-containing protein [Kofleriaceae bacterium]|nr:VIT domain-containing protein [Kofleriaceae bacterium]